MTRRIGVALLLAVMATPLVGAAPSMAAPTPTQSLGLESVCPTPTPGTAQCQALIRTDLTRPASAVSPQGSPPSGYGPSDLRGAYNLPSAPAGAGLTVAIVDAYDLPTAAADLAAYRTQFGLPVCPSGTCFRKVNQDGNAGPYPAVSAAWGIEIALDIDMVSAICPACNILLVEADSNNYSDLAAAVDTAASMGAVAVSNSYAGPEWSGEAYYDSHFDHPGVAITVSAGDCGYGCAAGSPGIGYPAASPKVIAVGGTKLIRDVSAPRGWTESAWGHNGMGGGSGCSLYEAKPSWQPAGACGGNRGEADVSAVADPSTGVAAYEAGRWMVTGGTSAAAPIIAATYALAGAPAAGTDPASYPYADPSSLNDVIGGNNDVTQHTCAVDYLCNGLTGYDGPTGLGTPNGTDAFDAVPTGPGKPINFVATAGNTTVRLAWTAPLSGGRPITSYTVTETEQSLGVRTCTMTGVSSCTVGGLGNGTEYTFTIHAKNSVGAGPESDHSSAATPAGSTVPDKPTGAAAATGVNSATVSWTAPVDDGGSAILSFTVTSSPGGLHCTTTGAPICKVLGLAGRGTYTFTVTASNGHGPGAASDPTSAVLVIAGSTYHPVTPARLLDTRIGNGLSDKLRARVPRSFQVTGRGNVLAGASAVTGNVTVTGSTGGWAVYLGPYAIAYPASSTLNFTTRQVVANGVTVALSADGKLSATYLASAGATTDLVFDVTGYFTPDATGQTYHPLTPARIVDSRLHQGLPGRLSANVPRTFTVWGAGNVPPEARAVTGNVTVTGSSGGWAVYVGPAPVAKPTTSTVNFTRGQVVANNLTVALSATGTLSATYMASAGATTDLVFDVTGYYTADQTGYRYVAINPTRLLDTRIGNGLSGKLYAATPRAFLVLGRGGVFGSATAVSGTATVVNSTGGWAIFVGPNSVAKPPTSTLNFTRGQILANGLTVALGSGGTLSATYMASPGARTDLVFDVTGYFVPVT